MEEVVTLMKVKELISDSDPAGSIKKLASIFRDKIAFTTSFGIEDQVITHIIFTNNIPVEVSTLDTGRLFPETYKVMNETRKKYKKNINVFFPDHQGVEKMVSDKGPFSFYYSRENRMECCRLRKVEPLNRALEGKKCWISGIRADQSDNRGRMDNIEFDETRGLFKFYPLFEWTYEEVRNFINKNNIPFNSMHDKGFVSIGCEPCTRAISPGEEFRAGRWWWEMDGKKECGCHIK